MRRHRRDGALGRRQESTDDHLSLIPGELGQAPELGRGRGGLPDLMGQRLPGGGACRRLGVGPPRSERGHGGGDRRGRLSTRPHLYDAGLRHRCGGEAAPGGGRAPERGKPPIPAWTGWAREFCRRVKFVCSDMWQPYLKVIGERIGGSIHVLDRFHIMKQFGRCERRRESGSPARFVMSHVCPREFRIGSDRSPPIGAPCMTMSRHVTTPDTLPTRPRRWRPRGPGAAR